jgi:alcohol dehydrogenase class IV
MAAVISFLTTVLFENGALHELGGQLRMLGISRPMIATDRGIVSAGLIGHLRDAIGAIPDSRLFAETPPNPTEAAVDAAVYRYRQAECDAIVAFGGGSPIDLAKAVALKATHEGDLVHYAASRGGLERITSAVAPVIAVPTTSGTGSEVGRATVIVMSDGWKRAIISPHLVPKLAICDPLLTVGLPATVTAGVGMDAIAHCVETLLSPRINPPAEAIALDGLARAAAWIEAACGDGKNIDARWQMMMASLEGGLAFQKGLGAVHALSHALGTLGSPTLHHGTVNAVMLPAVLRFNAPNAGDKYARMRQALGLGAHEDLAQWFAALNRRLNLPTSLCDMGVTRSVLPDMARMALADFSAQTNPRPVTEADLLSILEESFEPTHNG